MTSDWKEYKIADLGEIKTGKTPKTSIQENYGGNIPFLTPSDDMSVKYVKETVKKITESGLKEVKSCLLSAGSICVSCIGSDLGKVVITTKPTVTNQQINSILVDTEQFDTDFCYYLMVQLGKLLNYHSKTSTAVPIINKTNFSSYGVHIPDLETQQKIAKVLSAIDDKIELNNSINNNLEQQAQAIFKQIFSDISEDDLPSNWHKGTIGEIIELHDSKRVPLSGQQREKMKQKIYPYYGATSLMDYVDDYIFDGIYLLLGEDGTVIDTKGFPILQYVWGKFWVNNHAHILTGKNGFNVESLYLLFRQLSIKSIITGAVQAKISQTNLKSLEVIIPPIEVIENLNDKIKPLFSQIRSNLDENKVLTQLRDTLLPKLMNGEIDVSEVDISTDKLLFSEEK